MAVIGNKCDITTDREITAEDAYDYANTHGYQYIEASAKTGENINEMFQAIAGEILIKLNHE